MHSNMHCSAIYNSQDMEINYMFINRRMNKDVVHINNQILLSHKKGTNWVICRDVDGPRYCDIECDYQGGERGMGWIGRLGLGINTTTMFKIDN